MPSSMMTETPPLSPALCTQILRHWGIDECAPPQALLDQLVTAYTHNVPWESAFRIAKRGSTSQTADCARWPEEFWNDALERGGGGTCFESNYAFFSLLRALGYMGYLTINNMGDACGCHTAIVIYLNGERWLVDVGIPLYAPILLEAEAITGRESPFHTYTITPQDGGIFEICRDRHPHPYIFSLVDQPISDADYRTATVRDYEPEGHFLREVIITKVIDGSVWRFNGRARPPLLESFGAQTSSTPLLDSIAGHLSQHFGMDQQILTQALSAVEIGD
jgi:arylamine N-acetyltransferase